MSAYNYSPLVAKILELHLLSALLLQADKYFQYTSWRERIFGKEYAMLERTQELYCELLTENAYSWLWSMSNGGNKTYQKIRMYLSYFFMYQKVH